MSNAKPKLFGTDGIRGIVNQFPLTIDVCNKLGQALGILLKKKNSEKKIIYVVIAKDTRSSSDMIISSICSGLCLEGVNVKLAGTMPTPAVGLITRKENFDAGIMITASHNPYEYNGIKIFNEEGFKISEAFERELEDLILNKDLTISDIKNFGKISNLEDSDEIYKKHLFEKIPINLTNLNKIIIDCANGATSQIAHTIFSELSKDKFIFINTEPDGENINKLAGCMHPEIIARKVMEEGADIGFSFDGDGDRLIVADSKGNIVDGDKIMGLIAINKIKENKLEKNTIVATLYSNIGLEKALLKYNAKVEYVVNGDIAVVNKLKELGLTVGGEKSGHIINLDLFNSGDGISTALQIIEILNSGDKTITELTDEIKLYPQVQDSLVVENKIPIEDLLSLEEIKEIENKLKTDGRLLIRYSGTENKLRIMLQGKDKELLEKYNQKIKDVIKCKTNYKQ